MLRTAALHDVGASTLRAVLVALCAHGDVVGLPQPLAVLTAGSADSDSITTAIRTADLVGRVLPERLAVDAAARAVGAALAAAPGDDAVALSTAGGVLQRLARTMRPAAAPVDLDLLVPGAAPLPLELRELAFLCRFPWDGDAPDGLEALVGAYVATFAPSARVSLLLCPEVVGASVSAAEKWLVKLLTRTLGRSLDAIPDIVLETGPLTGETLPALHAAVGWAVALPGNDRRVVLEAMACGVPVIGATQGAPEGLLTEATGVVVGPAGLGRALEAAAGASAEERFRRGGQARLALLAGRAGAP
jgi:hypothetical protein